MVEQSIFTNNIVLLEGVRIMDNLLFNEVKKIRAGCRYGDNYISSATLDKIIFELKKAGEDPASFTDPRAPLEDEDARRVLEIIRKDEELYLRLQYLRARLQAGEDVTTELITFGYLIAKTEGHEEHEEREKDN